MRDTKDILGKFVEAILPPEGRKVASLFNSWSEAAGIDCSAHSAITDLRDGVIYVSADHPGWLQILHTKREKILYELKRKYPELSLRDIRFFIGELRLPPEEKEEKPAPVRAEKPGGKTSGGIKPAGEEEAVTGSGRADTPGRGVEKDKEQDQENEKKKGTDREAFNKLLDSLKKMGNSGGGTGGRRET